MSAAPASVDGVPLGRQPEDHIKVMAGKTPSKFTDPCRRASALSMKCLEDNSYDKAKCAEAFQVYRDCKKTWVEQRRKDRREGRPGAWD
ncbi:hypothetical protein IE81DRAFT_301304 [Ceraceosorus guamensis]|uniref:CHCH domain-containing protein n=1 Tax=Ceraceosorus guamensis TaxID=1522189 RepID=A0A316VZZ0_9BASI|nr:hypothetical protein IE81DRAFT_301304 [Ceraceosorus guamensis]PWN42999.1 hypothetical protein IE81DRAFT_301304 [Ceraceosorus guamensis]